MDNWTVSDVTGHAGVIGQYLVFQINQSEDSSKITIMSDTTCGQLHQRPITTASLYESNIERTHNSKAVHCIQCVARGLAAKLRLF